MSVGLRLRLTRPTSERHMHNTQASSLPEEINGKPGIQRKPGLRGPHHPPGDPGAVGRHRAGDAELALPHRLLHHHSRVPGRQLRHPHLRRPRGGAARGAAAAHGRVPGLRPGGAAELSAGGDPRRRRLHHQSSLPRRKPPRPGHVRDDADLLRRPVGGLLGHHGAQERHRRPCARELLEPGAGGVPGGTPGPAGEVHRPLQDEQGHRGDHRGQQPHAGAGGGRHPGPGGSGPSGANGGSAR